jgi:uncharacterized protein
MDLSLSESELAFQAEARDWLAANVPAEPLPSMDTAEGFEAHRRWERTLYDAGWGVVSWPEEYGGRGLGLIEWLVGDGRLEPRAHLGAKRILLGGEPEVHGGRSVSDTPSGTIAVVTINQMPAIEGWFNDSALLGTRCDACSTTFFPPERTMCRNPSCASTDLSEVELSRRGKVWTFSVNHYEAPAPYVAPTDPFEPYTVVAVELVDEAMVVLGQLASDADPSGLKVGDEVEVTIEPLFTDDEGQTHMVWKWKPTA